MQNEDEISNFQEESGVETSLLIPDEVVRMYSTIPHRIQELINDAGLEAKEDGEDLELKVTELKSMTYLTPDDVYYASLLSARGEPARDIVKQLLVRAEHLSNSTTQLGSPRKVNNISTSLKRSSAKRAMGQVSPIMGDRPAQRTPAKRRSISASVKSTKAYQKAASEHTSFRELTKDLVGLSPDAARLGLPHSRARSASPTPEVLQRHAFIGVSRGTISSNLIKSTNTAHCLRSKTARLSTVREPCTMQQYTIPGMVDTLRLRNKGYTNKAAFGSSSALHSSYLPHDIQGKLTTVKKQQRLAKLTAASQQDADTLIKNANRHRSPSPMSFKARTPRAVPA